MAELCHAAAHVGKRIFLALPLAALAPIHGQIPVAFVGSARNQTVRSRGADSRVEVPV
jgi:hypothetical protein